MKLRNHPILRRACVIVLLASAITFATPVASHADGFGVGPEHWITCSVGAGNPVSGPGILNNVREIGGSAWMECTPDGPDFANLTACLAWSPTNNKAASIILKNTCDADYGMRDPNLYAIPLGPCKTTGYYWTVITNAVAIHGDHTNKVDYLVYSSSSYIDCTLRITS